MGDPTKVCSACKQSLPLSAFHLARTKPDGRQAYCKACKATLGHRKFRRRLLYPNFVRLTPLTYRRALAEQVAAGNIKG